jgi:hypothetical protein
MRCDATIPFNPVEGGGAGDVRDAIVRDEKGCSDAAEREKEKVKKKKKKKQKK